MILYWVTALQGCLMCVCRWGIGACQYPPPPMPPPWPRPAPPTPPCPGGRGATSPRGAALCPPTSSPPRTWMAIQAARRTTVGWYSELTTPCLHTPQTELEVRQQWHFFTMFATKPLCYLYNNSATKPLWYLYKHFKLNVTLKNDQMTNIKCLVIHIQT